MPPPVSCWRRVRNVPRHVVFGIARAAAVFWRACIWCLASLWSGFLGLVSAAARFGKALYSVAIAAAKTAGKFLMISFRYAVACLHRYKLAILVAVLLSGLSVTTWYYWPPVPKPLHRHMIRPARPDVVHRLLPRDNKDTRNGDFYYLANILFIPLQTMLLLVGGAAGFWTLRQGHRFKQYDVEANCIKEYLAIEEQLAEADNSKIFRAARSYWVLMLYEYYWWRKDLISRELFANWCEFRVHRFRRNAVYTFNAATTGVQPSFSTYRQGYTHFRDEKVFPSPSRFNDLMEELMRRANAREDNLTWKDIERFRHGRGKVI